MQQLGSLLNKKINTLNIAPKVEASMILQKYNEVVLKAFGRLARNRVQAVYLKKDCLCVAVLSAAMSQELKLREKGLVKEVNDHFGKNVVNTVWYMC